MPYCVLHAALFPGGLGSYCIRHLITSALKIKQFFQQHSLSKGKPSIKMIKPVHTSLSL